MSTQESLIDRAEQISTLHPVPKEFTAMGSKQFEAFAAAQAEFLKKLQDANHKWFDRLQSDAKALSEFAQKLSAARTIPEMTAVGQEWASRSMERAVESAMSLFSDGQKLAEGASAQLSNGSRASSVAGGP